MNNDNQNAQVILKASLARTRITKILQKKPDFQLKLKLNALDSILSNLPTEEESPPQQASLPLQSSSVLHRAKEIITARKQNINFDSVYMELKKETFDQDSYNQLIVENLDKYTQHQDTTLKKAPPMIKHKSEQQMVHGYQLLPKVAISNQIKRKKETMRQLNQQLKSDQQLVKQQTLRELQQMKLPDIFQSVTINDLKQKENIQKFVLQGEFYQQWRKSFKLNKPPSLVQSFKSINQYLLDSADYLDKLNKIDRKQIKVQMESLNEFAGIQYGKLKIKTDPC
ncbi:unnamed protein product (macronuclear) [Paramecium tetraurelia]|uniref:Uncharacterized protein n=1 Tax=Paramecium tetraurelia TaxID=5888 RepID=A0BS06_PARTE|nr:uncharacterized protein GSPATT00031554001 [Paramecium tetraurelia]CAK61323.1 unnamed protein product [Paramecium tetraurelia]|eukprot:XP_001428721.1 hypothetical protein (macronuclear) [Paramecium tetraurelia strain d4-2]